MTQVRFENHRLRVLELRLPPGENEPMHSHPAYLVLVLQAATMRMSGADGVVSIVELPSGHVSFSGPATHAGENVGLTELHEIIVELMEPDGERTQT